MPPFFVMDKWVIYTDGSYRPSKKKMGIGIVWLKNDEKVFEYSRGIPGGTNSVAELTAIGIALKSIVEPLDSLTLVSDSEYAIGCIFNEKWNPVKNVELINAIKKEAKRVEKLVHIDVMHTYGHANDKWNNYVDSLAQKESSYDQ